MYNEIMRKDSPRYVIDGVRVLQCKHTQSVRETTRSYILLQRWTFQGVTSFSKPAGDHMLLIQSKDLSERSMRAQATACWVLVYLLHSHDEQLDRGDEQRPRGAQDSAVPDE